MTASAAFETTWGAMPVGDGRVRFCLWAPSQSRVALRVPGAEMAMSAADDGWFELITDRVAVDAPYSFVLDDGFAVPDPAARAQAGDVHGPSRLVDPRAFDWQASTWRGRPWEEAVIYELHVGTFSDAGTFEGVIAHLPHLVELGITAIEIMPVAQFGGDRGWGYDGVLLYAPHRAYGGPEGLKRLVDAAHGHGLMVLLDVVYNHFGPDGNYLHRYAPDFFDESRHTPWGAGIAYQKPPVRAFFRDNVLYWLEEYRLDGLRFDAIDQILDPSEEHILEEMARTVRERHPDRHLHLTTEDSRNIVSLHRRGEGGQPLRFTAEWNDDFHNVAHAMLTGEDEGYYRDFAENRVAKLARTLAEGYAYQGEPSIHHEGKPRGEPSGGLPPTAFVNFLQNHDQVGNRALGERLVVLADRGPLEMLTAMLLLSPAVPLLFMGEEWGETRPFCFFTDFHGVLATAVREGRRREFRAWSAFSSAEARSRIPDPNDPKTFADSKVDWQAPTARRGQGRLDLYRRLLRLRQLEIVPRLHGIGPHSGQRMDMPEGVIGVAWKMGDGSVLTCLANLTTRVASPVWPEGELLYAGPGAAIETGGDLPAWSVAFHLDRTPR